MDLTGGLDPASEYVLTETQTADGMAEGINWWLWDDAGEFCIPRFGVECMTPDWDTPMIQLCLVRPEGQQIWRQVSHAPVHKKTDRNGLASHFGAGPLWFDCIEPFHRYRARCTGNVMVGSFQEMLNGGLSSEKRVALEFEMEGEPIVPPWVQGSMSTDAAAKMAAGTAESKFMGGKRLEQLMRVKGTINLDGRKREFSGGALRIRRAGIRNISGFSGHCWQSAVFPDGKAFGYIAYPSGVGGTASYNEGYVFLGSGALIPARAVQIPWLKDFRFSREDVSVVMETADGRQFPIQGTSFAGMPSVRAEGSDLPQLSQAIARYRRDGKEALGVMERSALRKNMNSEIKS